MDSDPVQFTLLRNAPVDTIACDELQRARQSRRISPNRRDGQLRPDHISAEIVRVGWRLWDVQILYDVT